MAHREVAKSYPSGAPPGRQRVVGKSEAARGLVGLLRLTCGARSALGAQPPRHQHLRNEGHVTAKGLIARVRACVCARAKTNDRRGPGVELRRQVSGPGQAVALCGRAGAHV